MLRTITLKSVQGPLVRYVSTTPSNNSAVSPAFVPEKRETFYASFFSTFYYYQ